MTRAPLTIALLGAQGTGKTHLASALQTHFQNNVKLLLSDAPDVHLANTFEVILLMGLDLPVADASHRSRQIQADSELRNMLVQRNLAFHVVYGAGQLRLHNALHSISQHAPQLQHARPEITPRWTGSCETCGDGDCEHRLFTQLLQR